MFRQFVRQIDKDVSCLTLSFCKLITHRLVNVYLLVRRGAVGRLVCLTFCRFKKLGK